MTATGSSGNSILGARLGGVRGQTPSRSGGDAETTYPKFQLLGIKPMQMFLAQVTDEHGKQVTTPIFVVEDKAGVPHVLMDPNGETWFRGLIPPPKKLMEELRRKLDPGVEAASEQAAEAALSGVP